MKRSTPGVVGLKRHAFALLACVLFSLAVCLVTPRLAERYTLHLNDTKTGETYVLDKRTNKQGEEIAVSESQALMDNLEQAGREKNHDHN